MEHTTENPTTGLIPIYEWNFGSDYSYHRTLTCKNHPGTRFSSKNPYERHLFIVPGYDDCSCPLSDLLVIAEESQPPKR